MKHYTLALLCLLLLFACEEKPEQPTVAEEKLELLRGITWIPGTLTSDNNDLTVIYPSLQSFQLTFSGSLINENTNVNGTYQTTDNKIGILPSGSWEFKEGNEASTLIMDGIEVDYTVTSNSLRLDFFRPPPEGSRMEAISGEYIFNLVPQN